jgi:hypothetical protein
MPKYGIENFDDFVGLYVTPRTALEMGPTGQFKMQTRLAKFSNQPALMQIWQAVADVKLIDDVNLPGVPSVRGGKPQTVEVEKTPELGEYIVELNEQLERFANMSGREKRENRHIPLVVYGLARKSSLDMRMIDPTLPDQPGSKLNKAVQNMLRIYKETDHVKGTQMGFIDLFQDNPDNPRFNAYEEIKRKLIEGGIPENEILIMTDKVKGAKREALLKKLDDGEIRIALGSRERMGVGVNAQEHGAAIHQIDVPHRPMDIEQSNARFLRPRDNSEIPEIEILYYGVKGTLDAAMYDQLATKGKWIAQLLKGNLPGFDFNDPFDESTLAFDQQMAILSGNPAAVRKIFLENEIRQLEAMRSGHAREMRNSAEALKFLQGTTIPSLNDQIAKADQGQAKIVPALTAPEMTGQIGAQTANNRKEVSAAVDTFFKRKIDAAIAKAQEGKITGSLSTKPFTEVTINGIPLEMYAEIPGQWADVEAGALETVRKSKSEAVLKRYVDEGRIKFVHAPDNAIFYWRFAGPGQAEFKDGVNNAEGKVTTGSGLLNSLQAAAERVNKKPQDLRLTLQSKEKDVRNLQGFLTQPFAKEDQLRALRLEQQELLKTLGQASMAPQGTTAVDVGEEDLMAPPSTGELEIESAIEDDAKVTALKKSVDAAIEQGDIARANQLQKQMDQVRKNP